MTTRLIAGYGLLALMLVLGFIVLWFAVLRERWAHHRRSVRGERERIARRDALARPTVETD